MIGLLKKLIPARRPREEAKYAIGSKRQQAFIEELSTRSTEFRENAESFVVRFPSGMALRLSIKDPVLDIRASKDELFVTELNLDKASIANLTVRKDFRKVCKQAEAAKIDLSVTLPREMPPEQQDIYARFLTTAGFSQFIGSTETGLFIRHHQPNLRQP